VNSSFTKDIAAVAYAIDMTIQILETFCGVVGLPFDPSKVIFKV
jgi:hypothetical protein